MTNALFDNIVYNCFVQAIIEGLRSQLAHQVGERCKYGIMHILEKTDCLRKCEEFS